MKFIFQILFILICCSSRMISQELDSDDNSLTVCDSPPPSLAKFKEGGNAFSLYLMNQLKTKLFKTDQGGCCSIIFEFKVEASGKAVFSKVKRNECYISNAEEVLKEIIDAMPVWQPALQNGRPVATTYNIPFRVRLN